MRFASDLPAAVHPRRFRLRARLGVGDAAEAGCLWAVMGPLSVWALTQRGRDLRIDPDFVDAAFAWRTEGRSRPGSGRRGAASCTGAPR